MFHRHPHRAHALVPPRQLIRLTMPPSSLDRLCLAEPLEPRTLLASVPSEFVDASTGPGPDTVHLIRSADTVTVTVNALPPQSFHVNEMSGFAFDTKGADDTVIVDYSGGIPYVNSFSFTGDGGIDRLRLVGSAGGELFRLLTDSALYASTTINLSGVDDFDIDAGAGNDTITVGDLDGDRRIASAIPRNAAVTGGAGSDSLLLYDQNDLGDDAYTITPGSFDKTNFGLISLDTLEAITLNTGLGVNTVTLNAPSAFVHVTGIATDSIIYDDSADPAGNDQYTIDFQTFSKSGDPFVTWSGLRGFTLHANHQNNNITIQSVANNQRLLINGNDGNDSIRFGGGNVAANNPQSISFNGGNGSDAVFIHDELFASPTAFTITPTSITRTGWNGLTYSTLEFFNLYTGAPINTFNVNNTSDNSIWHVYPAGGNDIVNVNESGPGSLVVIHGSPGLDDVNVNADNAGIAEAVLAPEGWHSLGALAIGAGGIVRLAPDERTLSVNSLAFTGPTAGQLDLTNNAMVIRATAATRHAVYADVLARLATGINRDGPLFWTGPGINSSDAAATGNPPGTLTAVGAILNDNAEAGLDPGPIYSVFLDLKVTANDILLRYTWFGDADLSGVIDGTDYLLIDNAFSGAATGGGWLNGNFDYSTGSPAVDGTDYFLIDNAFSFQGKPLFTRAAIPRSDWLNDDDAILS